MSWLATAALFFLVLVAVAVLGGAFLFAPSYLRERRPFSTKRCSWCFGRGMVHEWDALTNQPVEIGCRMCDGSGRVKK